MFGDSGKSITELPDAKQFCEFEVSDFFNSHRIVNIYRTEPSGPPARTSFRLSNYQGRSGKSCGALGAPRQLRA